MSQPASSSTTSGFTWVGFFALLGIIGLVICLGSAFAGGPTYSQIPGSVLVAHHHHTHNCCNTCNQTPCACAQPCCKSCNHNPCCCTPAPCKTVCYPPEPTFHGEVDGFETSGQLRCHNSHSIKMGGSRVTATGVESVMNAQLLHEHALNTRSRDFSGALCTTRALTTPPKEVVRTVTKTVYLSVPAPPVTLIPSYTVYSPTVVYDAYGRYWHYRNYGWYIR